MVDAKTTAGYMSYDSEDKVEKQKGGWHTMLNSTADLRDAFFGGLESETYKDDNFGLELTDLKAGDYSEYSDSTTEYSVIGTDANTGYEIEITFTVDEDDIFDEGHIDKIEINTGSDIIEINVQDNGERTTIDEIRVFDADKGFGSSGEAGSGTVYRCVYPDRERSVESIIKDPDKAIEDVKSHRADTGIGAQTDMVYRDGKLSTEIEYKDDGNVLYTRELGGGVERSEDETTTSESAQVTVSEALADTITSFIDGEATEGDVASHITDIINGLGEETGGLVCAEAIEIALNGLSDDITEDAEERFDSSDKIDIEISDKQSDKPQGFIETVFSKIQSVVDIIKNALSDKIEKFTDKIESLAKSGSIKGGVIGVAVGMVIATAATPMAKDFDVSKERGAMRIELTKGEDGKIAGTVTSQSYDVSGSGVAGKTDSEAKIQIEGKDGHISGTAVISEDRKESDGDTSKSDGVLRIEGEIGSDKIVIDIESVINSCDVSGAAEDASNLENDDESSKGAIAEQNDNIGVDQENDSVDNGIENNDDDTDNDSYNDKVD